MTNFMVGFQEIPGFLDYYVTESGDVYSTKYGDYRKLKPSVNNAGYLKVGLSYKKKSKYFDIHRLMAMAFLKMFNKCVVNHIDGNKLNNNLSNLEVCTHLQNVRHAIKSGLANQVGENHSAVKLNDVKVKEIKKLLGIGDLTHVQIAQLCGVCRGSISNISTGQSWRHLR